MQPLIAPLYQGKSAHELLAVFLGQADRSNYDLVRDYWKSQQTVGDFEQFWRKALHDGVVPNTALATKNVSVQVSALQVGAPDAPLQGLELNFRPDPTIYDGRFANNGWLQELPKPLTKLTWDNAAMISPATAARLGISYKPNSWGGGGVQTDVVNLKYKDRSLSFPAWIVPGHPDDCVTVHLGYGRTRIGRVGEGAGANAYALRTSDAPWIGSGLSVEKTGERYTLACTQLHHNIDTEDLKARQAEIIRSGTLAEYQKDPALAPKEAHHSAEALSLYPEYEYEGYAWGMAIDLTSCIGCNACVVACQAENNIPVVGKEQVLFGREMHWLRIDQYFKGGQTNPQVYFQPMLCQHCERAPCEVVCPVNATVHDAEGLNNMVYNRCVGTRYCSNNCPYKVRRFNFLLFQDWKTPSLKLQRNPDVTVRSRGVMEKCSFCTQRIQAAKIEAAKENRKVRDGEILTACQAVCPTEAIVFGDINDPNSRVAKMKQEKRNYSVLESLNTKPRTSYLAALRNPNPEIEG
jgi:molybdopterin-containing oxidoreductase family iron-sulfur binding subunit